MSRLRKNCALICALWVVVAVIRLHFALRGHPGDTASLVLMLFSGACALVGLLYALAPRDGG